MGAMENNWGRLCDQLLLCSDTGEIWRRTLLLLLLLLLKVNQATEELLVL
jgi:hypothetical protein